MVEFLWYFGFLYVVLATTCFTLALVRLAFFGMAAIEEKYNLGVEQSLQDWQRGRDERFNELLDGKYLREKLRS